MRLPPLLISLTFGTLIACTASVAQPNSSSQPKVETTDVSDYRAPTPDHRLIVFISDLHLGVGVSPVGGWDPTEDFRWPNALKGFLDQISGRGGGTVDLVILGDLLELWQPPKSLECEGAPDDPNLGCTPQQLAKISEYVCRAHAKELQLLRDFALRGENRVHIVPGNHDSGLLLAPVWAPLGAALGVDSGRIDFVKTGVWRSNDGLIVAEHGHQIGADANSFGNAWPTITSTPSPGGQTYVIRSWGERFVQKLFNREEPEYEIIDNLSPETVGVKYRMADRGAWTTVGDIAQFIAFNLFETSWKQLGQIAGANKSGKVEWNVEIGRRMGYRLFYEALPDNDPLRTAIDGATELQGELKALANDRNRLSDDDVKNLCDELKSRNRKNLCALQTAGATFESLLIPRSWVMRAHVARRKRDAPRMQIFVYGHTHQLEEGWPLAVDDLRPVTIFNTGAFQRTTDEAGFLKRAQEKSWTPAEALRKLKLEDLPACFTAVLIDYSDGVFTGTTWRWSMQEDGPGKLVLPGAPECQ
jgi:UDP-2,3-diacylglucosamine pyrophosphatase LpxH